MGLDWMLNGRISKPGQEEQFRRLTAKLAHLHKDERLSQPQQTVLRDDLEAALKQVALSPFEVIGAPRLGIDEAANEWFNKNVYTLMQGRVAQAKKRPDQNTDFIRFWDRPLDAVLQDEKGKYVVELAQHHDGIASVSGIMCSSLDFRGKVVALSPVIDSELRREAYDDHEHGACLDYADKLELAVMEFKAAHRDWAMRQVEAECGGVIEAKEELGYIESAVRWLRFWGSRGFGYSAWY